MTDPKPITVEDVFNSRESFTRLSQQPVALATAKKIMDLNTYLSGICADFLKQRASVAEKMGSPAEEGGWKLEPDAMAGFCAEARRLANEEVEIPQAWRLTLAELSEVRISAGDLERVKYAVVDLP